MKKTILRIAGIFLLIMVITVVINIKTIKKVKHVMTLFDEENIIGNFLDMESSFAVREISKSTQPQHLATNISYEVPTNFTFGDSLMSSREYMKYSNTTGLLIIQNDTIIHKTYSNGLTDTITHISWSMAKSFVSALVGIAVEDGLIESIEDPITLYLPKLSNSGYNQVKIRDILQMSSGVGFNEDYRDFKSDINRFGRYFALGKSFSNFVLSLDRERPPGTYNHYVSINTQVLGMLVSEVTGMTLSEYLYEKIWEPAGMEYNAQWIVDNTGMEMALGGLNVTLTDYAKFGLLYLHNGRLYGKDIIPASWIEASMSTEAPHLRPGDNPNSDSHFGYGFQWWIPEKVNGLYEGDYFAAGIYNQYIYISPARSLVIVKLSANHHFKQEGDNSKDIHIALLQQIANDFDRMSLTDTVAVSAMHTNPNK